MPKGVGYPNPGTKERKKTKARKKQQPPGFQEMIDALRKKHEASTVKTEFLGNPGTEARDKRARTYSNRRIKRTVENEATALGRARNTVRKFGNRVDAALFPGLGGAQAARDIEAGQSRKRKK
jgi:hypothetical protein